MSPASTASRSPSAAAACARPPASAAASPIGVDAFAAVDPGALPLDVADGMIENVVGTYALPFAVAMNFRVDGTDAFVPMVVEEPSIVAAASNAARIARPVGFLPRSRPSR